MHQTCMHKGAKWMDTSQYCFIRLIFVGANFRTNRILNIRTAQHSVYPWQLTLWLLVHVDVYQREARLVTHTQLLVEHL